LLPNIDHPSKLPVSAIGTRSENIAKSSGTYPRENDVCSDLRYTVMRIGELTILLVQSVDLDRAVIHILQSKNKKDRYFPICSHSIRGIKTEN